MKLGHFFAVRNVGVCIIEKGGSVEGVRSAMNIGAAVEIIVPEAVLMSM